VGSVGLWGCLELHQVVGVPNVTSLSGSERLENGRVVVFGAGQGEPESNERHRYTAGK